jgi:8-oxo-dGTP pyrophosphatase MutT (NUDIX family)
MPCRERDVVRALIVSPDSKILLVKIILSDRSFWITPGGGKLDHEDNDTSLRRELSEEIGRDKWNIETEVWFRSHTFDFDGETLTQHETFYWVPSEWFHPPQKMPDEHENQYFGGFKWWTIRELQDSNEDFAPREIASHLKVILENGLPVSPIDVGL